MTSEKNSVKNSKKKDMKMKLIMKSIKNILLENEYSPKTKTIKTIINI